MCLDFGIFHYNDQIVYTVDSKRGDRGRAVAACAARKGQELVVG